MTREQAKQNLIDFGIEEPTNEQISNYLNQVNGEVVKEKNRADRYKADAEKSAELQKQLDEIANQNLSDIEIANKKYEDAQNLIQEKEGIIAQLQKEKLVATLTSKFAEKGLTGEHYASVINAYSLLGEEEAIKQATSFVDGITSAKEELVKNANDEARRKLLEETPNPDGGNGEEEKEEESYASKYAKEYSQKMNPQNKVAEDGNAPVYF